MGKAALGSDVDSQSGRVGATTKSRRKGKSALSKAGGNVLRQALAGQPSSQQQQQQQQQQQRQQDNRMHPRDYYKHIEMSSEQQAVHELIDPPDSFRENYPPLPVARVAPQQQHSSSSSSITHHRKTSLCGKCRR